MHLGKKYDVGGFTMKCPYCGAEMKKGFVLGRGGAGMHWLPEGEKVGFSITNKKIEKQHGIILVDCYEFGALKRTAYCCPTCRKIIMDF
jgi:hypothetical protein